MSRKVAIVIERANISLGGAERSVFELAPALSARGFHVHILAAKGQTKARNVHILCGKTPGKRTSYLAFEEALRTHLSQNQYDIVHSVLPFHFADVYQPRGGTYAEAIFRNAVSYQNKVIEWYKRLTTFGNLRRTTLLHSERKLCSAATGPEDTPFHAIHAVPAVATPVARRIMAAASERPFACRRTAARHVP